MWCVVKSKINDHSGTNRGDPRRKILELIRRIDKEDVALARTCFRTRLEVVIDVGDIHAEWESEKKCSDHTKELK